MKLNAVELLLVNNPVRRLLLRQSCAWLYEAAGYPVVDRALEIGCGDGSGIVEIRRRFGPLALDAFDLDEKQVGRARERLTADGARIKLWVGDAARIEAPEASYDAVFEFTIFHHVPDWPRAVSEVARVLRPGGRFLFEELSLEFFAAPVVGPLLRRLTAHPWESMFSFPEFRRALAENGLHLVRLQPRWVAGWYLGVAEKR